MNKTLLILALALAAMIGLPAHATPISTTLNLGTVYTGSIPDGTAPWLVATFTYDPDVSTTAGTLTLTSSLSGPDFLQGKSGKNTKTGWSFYLDQALSSWSCESGGTCADGVSTDSINKAGPVPGPFNLIFGWTSKNRFMSGDSAVYDLTFANALTSMPFVAGDGGWSSVAHVQGISPKSCSGWIVSGDDGQGADGGTACTRTNVPEPASLGMFGLGVMLLGLFIGLRRRW